MTPPEPIAPRSGLEIAVVGMAGRFPGARNVDDYWRNLCAGQETISFFSREELAQAGVPCAVLSDPSYVRARGVLGDVECFDASFFDISPKEAEVTDPQHRLFLECAWEALEDAGYDSERYPGSIGVYGGAYTNTYRLNLYSNPAALAAVGDLQVLIGNESDYLTTRVSYKLRLRGPSVAVQTACSTSLVAVHMAGQALLSGECDIALAGGVTVRAQEKTGYVFQPEGNYSPDGHCRAFDAKARGAVSSNGVGIVVLKRLEDALADRDNIRAIIRGSAINNDASTKVGYTAPSVEGQSNAIIAAHAMADVRPETIGYIETHGSGTAFGDPVEIEALTRAFRASTNCKRFCAIGSVKTNIGHVHTAAGVAGLIKTILALEHKSIPPSLYFETPNPRIDFDNSPFYVITALCPWHADGYPRRAGVSSFGIGGTNAHVVLEEAPPEASSGPSRPWQLCAMSAKTTAALEAVTRNLVRHLKQSPSLDMADVAYTLNIGRKPFAHRRVVVCQNLGDAVSALETSDAAKVLTATSKSKERPVAFMFPGLGDHYVNMAWDLYQYEPIFREHLDHCCDLLQSQSGIDLRSALYPPTERPAEVPPQANAASSSNSRLDLRRIVGRDSAQPSSATQQLSRSSLAQPAVFGVEYALARLWMAWGVRPQAMIGYSIGEYVAACLAGVFSLEDALLLLTERARMIDELGGGAMLAVPIPEEQVARLLPDCDISLAAINGPSSCVIAGTIGAIESAERRLAEREVASHRVQASHAFHSKLMEPIADDLTRVARSVTLNPPLLPYVSGVTGDWVAAEDVADPGYWARHMCRPVRFAAGVRKLWQASNRILLEVGPGQNLGSLAIQHPVSSQVADPLVLPSLRHAYDYQSDIAFLLRSVGRLWLAGVSLDWTTFYADQRRLRVPLPTYPFERRRHWVDLRPRLDVAQVGDGEEGLVGSAADRGETEMLPSSAVAYVGRVVQNPYVAPRDGLEETIAAIWRELLGVEQIGIQDNFFELGGHSLLGVNLVSRIRKTFHVNLPLRALYEALTVSELATVIRTMTESRQEPPLEAKGWMMPGTGGASGDDSQNRVLTGG
jgi:phthiocerol/phenolphthiocerol synthesis type-I polyketide synthase E